jgi:branched-chain amino acid transport system ATP-binding protein
VDAALRLLDLEQLGDLMPDKLSQGQRKLVGVARALAARPRVICLDEPAAGLDTAESDQLGRRLREIVEQGTALLLVDHDMGLVLSVCDRVVVLDFGREIARGTTAEVRSNPKVVEAYLGGAAAEVMGKGTFETPSSAPA